MFQEVQSKNLFKQVLTIDKNNQKGIALLMTVSILALVFVAISISITRTNLVNFQTVEILKNSRSSLYHAESGVEDTMIQLEENLSYPGNPTGEVTPALTYFSQVDKLGNLYDVTAWAIEGDTRRQVTFNLNISFDIPAVTTKAAYMADFFWISGEGARVRGDVWTNDDFDIIEGAVVEGNLGSSGKGSFAVNWVWDGVVGGNPALQGGRVLDNPDTTDVVEGNIIAYDSVRVSGPSAYVQGNVTSNDYVWEMFGGNIAGTITQYAGYEFQQIPVPIFEFSTYQQLAITQGTYFNNANQFENYLDSIDNGTERRLADDIYYVKSGAVKVEAGSPVYLDGLLVVEDNLYIYSEWYQVAQNDLPAIVCGKDLNIQNKFNFFTWNYDYSGPVRITGIVFTEKDIDIFRTFNTEDIIIEGAAWAGDDIYIGEHSYVHYTLDPLNIEGFGFVTGISGLEEHYWEEVI